VRWSVHKRPCRLRLPRELEGALCGSGGRWLLISFFFLGGGGCGTWP
jgi:hypothetical protein